MSTILIRNQVTGSHFFELYFLGLLTSGPRGTWNQSILSCRTICLEVSHLKH